MSPALPASGFRRVRYSGDQGTSYRTVFEREYGGTGLSPVDDSSTDFVYTIIGDDDVSLRTLDTGRYRRTGTIGARPDHVVFWLLRGTLTMDFGDRVAQVTPGAAWICSASAAYRFEAADTLYNSVHVRDGFLREVAAELGIEIPPGELVFEQQDDRIAGLAPLRTLMKEVAGTFGDPSLPADERRELDARIAEAVLEVFPVRVGGTAIGASGRLRDAVSFVEAHAADEITLSDIADAAGLSDRGVQQLFKRNLGTTPMSYLRDVRLDRVRQEILFSPDSPVGGIAKAWRLNHLGRFASEYRRRFGELPTETVRSRDS
ncbi:helix-turn-helix transcriptional regulator [Frondihabitans australicus]|uniref:helix-turn-helix transcriptional regulator n=1 Tax=Frondihabitans australicus TaxID=386892 RepID=UPI000EABF2F4|nr:helix-turn-helix transcriptional regulator [Frondihabitans australicus]